MPRKHQNPKRSTNSSKNITGSNRTGPQDRKSRSLVLAKKEIRTTADYGCLMAALITDVIEEKVTPTILLAAVAAGRQLIKAAELNLKYGRKIIDSDRKKEPCLQLLTGQVI